MRRFRSLTPVLLALLALAAGLAIFLMRRPATTTETPGGIRVVKGDSDPANPIAQNTAAASTSELPATVAGTPVASSAGDDGLPTDLDPNERAAMMPRMFRKEARDPAWAPGTEKALQHAFAGIPYLGADAPMAVRCATSICEVSGEIDRTASTDNLNTAIQQLQARTAKDRLPAGLGDSTVMFGPLPDRPGGNGYRVYVRRR